jgi:hypothetical protein
MTFTCSEENTGMRILPTEGVRILLIGLRSTMPSATHQLKKALKARKRLLMVLLPTPVSWIYASHILICKGVTLVGVWSKP